MTRRDFLVTVIESSNLEFYTFAKGTRRLFWCPLESSASEFRVEKGNIFAVAAGSGLIGGHHANWQEIRHRQRTITASHIPISFDYRAGRRGASGCWTL